jgi:hypothetical protein
MTKKGGNDVSLCAACDLEPIEPVTRFNARFWDAAMDDDVIPERRYDQRMVASA